MLSKLVVGAAVTALAFAVVPASAKMKGTSSTEASMAKVDAMMMKMPDGENKTKGMQEMTSAKSSMSQKDMVGCSEHMNSAMKIGMTKPKKM